MKATISSFVSKKLKPHTSTYSRQKNKTANRRSTHHPACLPHSGPECQKAVQWGVPQQRSLYGNDPADTVLCKHRAGGDETQQPEPWCLLSLVSPPLPELLQMCKILALATKTPTPYRLFNHTEHLYGAGGWLHLTDCWLCSPMTETEGCHFSDNPQHTANSCRILPSTLEN